MSPFSAETWSTISGILNVVAIPSIIANLGFVIAFVLKSYIPSLYFSGHWSGALSDERGSLEFFVVFYKSSGQLVGQIYYQGQYTDGHYVRGFDRLANDTTRFKRVGGDPRPRIFVRAWRRIVGTRFEAEMDRAVHTIHNQKTGKYAFETGGPPYVYSFRIRKRFWYPRLSCSVSSRADEDGCSRNFSGELVKQGGIPRFSAG